MTSTSDVDNPTDTPVPTMGDVIRTADRRGGAKKGRTTPLWTEECREVKHQYRIFLDDKGRKAFSRTVKREKR